MSHKILVVDDDDINSSLMKFRLEDKGYEVTTAKDGLLALEALKVQKFELIFLDINMPNMNGYEFMLEFRKIEGNKNIPVVMLTSNETMEEAFEIEGVSGYFVKPIKFPKIYERIIELLGKCPE